MRPVKRCLQTWPQKNSGSANLERFRKQTVLQDRQDGSVVSAVSVVGIGCEDDAERGTGNALLTLSIALD